MSIREHEHVWNLGLSFRFWWKGFLIFGRISLMLEKKPKSIPKVRTLKTQKLNCIKTETRAVCWDTVQNLCKRTHHKTYFRYKYAVATQTHIRNIMLRAIFEPSTVGKQHASINECVQNDLTSPLLIPKENHERKRKASSRRHNN